MELESNFHMVIKPEKPSLQQLVLKKFLFCHGRKVVLKLKYLFFRRNSDLKERSQPGGMKLRIIAHKF